MTQWEVLHNLFTKEVSASVADTEAGAGALFDKADDATSFHGHAPVARGVSDRMNAETKSAFPAE